MALERRTSRRQFIQVTGGALGMGVLAACATPASQQAPPKAALSGAPVTISFFKRGTLQEPDVET
ncbi:MAG TPA: twin-arginine translocation signal domain-containing protein, partial [Chloroflexota bacterium]|nr:twin-arginine translocation signal domain-containing protein [Chloroflexota bacterium]